MQEIYKNNLFSFALIMSAMKRNRNLQLLSEPEREVLSLNYSHDQYVSRCSPDVVKHKRNMLNLIHVMAFLFREAR